MKKGFTLVELLVVVSIITLLSGSVYAYSAQARERARDAVQITETSEIKKALEVYHLVNNSYPTNWINGSVAQEGTNAYNHSMNQLVVAGLLPAVPESPRGDTYYYYNFNDGETSPYVASAQYDLDTPNAPNGLIFVGFETSEENPQQMQPACVTHSGWITGWEYAVSQGYNPQEGGFWDGYEFYLPWGYYQFPEGYASLPAGYETYSSYLKCPYPVHYTE